MAEFTKLSSLDYAEQFRYNGETYYRGAYRRKRRTYQCFKRTSLCGCFSIVFIYLSGSTLVEKL